MWVLFINTTYIVLVPSEVQYVKLKYIVLQVHHFTSCYTSILEAQFDEFSWPFHSERFVHTSTLCMAIQCSLSVQFIWGSGIPKHHAQKYFCLFLSSYTFYLDSNKTPWSITVLLGMKRLHNRHPVFLKTLSTGYNIMSKLSIGNVVSLGLVTNTISIHCMLQ